MVLSTNRGVVVLLGVCAQVLITAVFLWRVEPYIENRLERDGKQVLQEANVSWARIEADGRDVRVSGMAPTARLKDKAVGLIQSVDGVRKVNDELLIATATAPTLAPEEVERRAQEFLADIEDEAPIFALDLPYELHMQVEATVLTISGLVPDGIAKESLLNLATRELGNGRVIDRLIVSPGAPDDYLTAATSALRAAGALTSGVVMVNDYEVIVQGLSANNLNAEGFESLLGELPGSYQSNIQVGDQRELEALLRIHPSLAARVGAVNDKPRDETIIETIRVPVDSNQNTTAQTLREKRQQEQNQARSRLESNSGNVPASQSPTQVTQPIDSTECAFQLQEQLRKQAIGFDTGSSDIDSNSQQLMQELVRISKLCPQVVLEIAGHTDDLGTRENNLSLSQRRAEAVMEYLVRNGVSLGRLRAVGYGEERPLVENTTADRRKQNRRIEFSLLDES